LDIVVVPLTQLTQKSAAWHFDDTCHASFKLLKEQFTHAPVSTKLVPDSEMIVETDALDYALAAIIFCQLPDGEIHPIAFYSHSFNSAKLNYDTHDKELLAIFEAFKHWWQYLEGSRFPIDVVTNHKIWNTSLQQRSSPIPLPVQYGYSLLPWETRGETRCID
jgi:RNase H-like domain found in reverse transcriptase